MRYLVANTCVKLLYLTYLAGKFRILYRHLVKHLVDNYVKKLIRGESELVIAKLKYNCINCVNLGNVSLDIVVEIPFQQHLTPILTYVVKIGDKQLFELSLDTVHDLFFNRCLTNVNNVLLTTRFINIFINVLNKCLTTCSKPCLTRVSTVGNVYNVEELVDICLSFWNMFTTLLNQSIKSLTTLSKSGFNEFTKLLNNVELTTMSYKRLMIKFVTHSDEVSSTVLCENPIFVIHNIDNVNFNVEITFTKIGEDVVVMEIYTRDDQVSKLINSIDVTLNHMFTHGVVNFAEHLIKVVKTCSTMLMGV